MTLHGGEGEIERERGGTRNTHWHSLGKLVHVGKPQMTRKYRATPLWKDEQERLDRPRGQRLILLYYLLVARSQFSFCYSYYSCSLFFNNSEVNLNKGYLKFHKGPIDILHEQAESHWRRVCFSLCRCLSQTWLGPVENGNYGTAGSHSIPLNRACNRTFALHKETTWKRDLELKCRSLVSQLRRQE